MKKQKKRIRLLAWLGILILTLQGTFPAWADSWDAQRRGSITITTSYITGSGDNQTRVPVAGVELSLYRIAAVDVQAGQIVYLPSPGLESFEKLINSGFTEGGNVEAAEAISKADNLEALLCGSAQITGADGKAEFADLKNGMYLVKQTAAKKGYYTMTPFLIPVPMMEEDGTGWNYTIEARPKIERHSDGGNPPDGGGGGSNGGGGNPPPSPTTAPPETVPPFTETPEVPPTEQIERLPQTGMRRLPVILCAMGGFVLIGGGWVMQRRDRRRETDKKPDGS